MIGCDPQRRPSIDMTPRGCEVGGHLVAAGNPRRSQRIQTV